MEGVGREGRREVCRCEGFTHTGRWAMKLASQVKTANLGLDGKSTLCRNTCI